MSDPIILFFLMKQILKVSPLEPKYSTVLLALSFSSMPCQGVWTFHFSERQCIPFSPFLFLMIISLLLCLLLTMLSCSESLFMGHLVMPGSNESNVRTCQKDIGANLKRFPLAKYGLT